MEWIDTIEYLNTKNASVRIDLFKKSDKCFVVNLTIGRHTSTRSFATEAQANEYIISLQR